MGDTLRDVQTHRPNIDSFPCLGRSNVGLVLIVSRQNLDRAAEHGSAEARGCHGHRGDESRTNQIDIGPDMSAITPRQAGSAACGTLKAGRRSAAQAPVNVLFM